MGHSPAASLSCLPCTAQHIEKVQQKRYNKLSPEQATLRLVGVICAASA
jgi:hypothetical protein